MTLDAQSEASPQVDGSELPMTAGAILDSLDEAVLVTDREGAIRSRNAVARAHLPAGSDLDAVLRDARTLTPFDGWTAELGRVIDTGSAVHFECALAVGDAKPQRLVTVRCTPLLNQGGGHTEGAVVTVQEAARPAGLEDRLEVSKRLASLGKLATRVAHELNNPLDGILRYINLAMRVAGDASEPKLKSYLAESRTGAMRMVQIIGDLLEFSRSTGGDFDDTDINELVEQAIRSRASAAEAARVIVAVDFQTPKMPAVHGSRLYQVCCNLIKNAIEAMPRGGQLTVTTGIVNHDVVIRVADTGVGLPTPAEKVFEPFFTTKGPGEGTGLGLAICKDFIEDMQGTIVAEPQDPCGAVFTVRIPPSSYHRPSPIAQSVGQHEFHEVDACHARQAKPE